MNMVIANGVETKWAKNRQRVSALVYCDRPIALTRADRPGRHAATERDRGPSSIAPIRLDPFRAIARSAPE
jgi:hypothetical protein